MCSNKVLREFCKETPRMSLWPHIVHSLAKQQSKSFSVVLLYTYKYFVTTFKRTIKPIIKSIYNKQKCPAGYIIAHRDIRSYARLGSKDSTRPRTETLRP